MHTLFWFSYYSVHVLIYSRKIEFCKKLYRTVLICFHKIHLMKLQTSTFDFTF